MSITINIADKTLEKAVIAFLKENGIEYSLSKPKTKKSTETVTKLEDINAFVKKWGGALSGAEKSKDEKVKRILRKHS